MILLYWLAPLFRLFDRETPFDPDNCLAHLNEEHDVVEEVTVWLTLHSMCDDAFALNVLTREKRLKAINYRSFYALKDMLIQYLYQHGYSIEVLEHKQDFECWTCGGDEDGCSRCNYTGVYRTVYLYAFVFRVAGHTYKWHRPKGDVSYPVTVTQPMVVPYAAPASKEYVEATERQEIWMLARLYIGLRLRGVRKLPRFNWDAFLVGAFLPKRWWRKIFQWKRAFVEKWNSLSVSKEGES